VRQLLREKRRQVCRRNSDEQAQRALDEKLKDIPESSWRSKVNKQGLTLQEYVKRHSKSMKSENKRLSTKFWTECFAEFDLVNTCADNLEDPPSGLSIDTDLLKALQAARNGNPTGKPTLQLERYLEHCAPLNKQELFGLFHAVMEGPDLPRPFAVKLHIAVLKYSGRTELTNARCYRYAVY